MRIVQKYGGTSVGTIEKIQNIARHLKGLKENGNDLVVVVSAMGKMTDELIQKAKQINPTPNRRELDRLMSTGEQQTIALLSMALHAEGIDAISLTGFQAGIKAEGLYTKAKIKDISVDRIENHLEEGKVVIVAGFQGYNEDGDVVTFGTDAPFVGSAIISPVSGSTVSLS